MNPDASFPADGYREHQREAIIEVLEKLQDHDVVVLDAPTGSGKSLILYTVALAMGASSFYVTPLNTLVDQLDEDDLLEHMLTIKGRSNYACIHPRDVGTPVDKAVCQREMGSPSECPYYLQCPYYGKKARAQMHPMVGTNLAFLMSDSMLPPRQRAFGTRPLLIVDECQKIEDFALDFVNIDFTERNVPPRLWNAVGLPEDEGDALRWAREELRPALIEIQGRIASKKHLTPTDVERLQWYERFQGRVDQYIAHAHAIEYVVDMKPYGVLIEPLHVNYFLGKLLWWRGGKVILSSATVPGEEWLKDVGLSSKRVAWVKVSSSFPTERRPVHVEPLGKMTQKEREETAPKIAKRIMELADEHEGQKGMVHCRAYSIMELIASHIPDEWLEERALLQDRDDREGSLAEWQDGDAQVFFSVSMDEGIDLKYEACEWQVLAKALYKHLGNKRVRTLVFERNAWQWYMRAAAIQIQQAYGRAMRSEDDWQDFYILDTSAAILIDRNPEMFEEWFKDAIIDHRKT